MSVRERVRVSERVFERDSEREGDRVFLYVCVCERERENERERERVREIAMSGWQKVERQIYHSRVFNDLSNHKLLHLSYILPTGRNQGTKPLLLGPWHSSSLLPRAVELLLKSSTNQQSSPN